MHHDDIQKLKTILSQHKLQLTKARITTFELLTSPEPQSMSTILARAIGRVDRVSVYRNINVFEKLGIVHRIYIGWKYKLELSDQFMKHHHHVSCSNCGLIIDIEDDSEIDTFIASIATKFNFTVMRHQLEIEGLCNKCMLKLPSRSV